MFGNIRDTTISRRDNSLLAKCMLGRSPILKHFIEEIKMGFCPITIFKYKVLSYCIKTLRKNDWNSVEGTKVFQSD